MTEKSLARLEMELEELKDKKEAIPKPGSPAWGIVIMALGGIMSVIFDGLGFLLGLALILGGLLNLISALVSRGTYRRKHEIIDQVIKEKREEIVRAKEALYKQGGEQALN